MWDVAVIFSARAFNLCARQLYTLLHHFVLIYIRGIEYIVGGQQAASLPPLYIYTRLWCVSWWWWWPVCATVNNVYSWRYYRSSSVSCGQLVINLCANELQIGSAARPFIRAMYADNSRSLKCKLNIAYPYIMCSLVSLLNKSPSLAWPDLFINPLILFEFF